MSVLAEYQEAKKIYKDQKVLAPYMHLEPNRVPNQLRFDISPWCVSVARVRGGTLDLGESHPTGSYEESINRAAQEIASGQFLQPGYAAVCTFWPEDVKHGVVPIGSNQKFSSVQAVDQKLRTAFDELQLDPGYAYRAIGSEERSEADYIGIRLNGWQALQDALPKQVIQGRYWGPLAVLEVILAHFREALPDGKVVLGLVDPSSVYYFKVQNGGLGGIKLSPRSSIKDTEDLKMTLRTFGISEDPQVFLVDMTTQFEDTDAFCAQAAQQEGVAMNMLERTDLLEQFRSLTITGNAPLFPLALLQGGLHG